MSSPERAKKLKHTLGLVQELIDQARGEEFIHQANNAFLAAQVVLLRALLEEVVGMRDDLERLDATR